MKFSSVADSTLGLQATLFNTQTTSIVATYDVEGMILLFQHLMDLPVLTSLTERGLDGHDIRRLLPHYSRPERKHEASYGVYILLGTHVDRSSLIYPGSTEKGSHRIFAHCTRIRQIRPEEHVHVVEQKNFLAVHRVLAEPGWTTTAHVLGRARTPKDEGMIPYHVCNYEYVYYCKHGELHSEMSITTTNRLFGIIWLLWSVFDIM